MAAYYSASYLAQVRRLRVLGELALQSFPIKNYQLKFINHGENTTFKVSVKNADYLLRIHRAGYHSKAGITEEIHWLKNLSESSDISAQRPIKAKNGQFIITQSSRGVPEPRHCDILRWQDGQMRFKSLSLRHIEKTGELTAKLHQFTKSKTSIVRNYWAPADLLGPEAKLGSIDSIKGEYPKEYLVLNACRKKLLGRLNNYHKKNSTKFGLIHADLHFGNLIWSKGCPIPIDFDDCGFGAHMYDLAVTLSAAQRMGKMKKDKKYQLFRESLLNGYSKHLNLSRVDLKAIDDFILARYLVMIAWRYDRSDNPRIKEIFKKNIAVDTRELEKHLC